MNTWTQNKPVDLFLEQRAVRVARLAHEARDGAHHRFVARGYDDRPPGPSRHGGRVKRQI